MPMVMLITWLRSIDVSIVDDVVNSKGGRRVVDVGLLIVERHLGQVGEAAIKRCEGHVGDEVGREEAVAIKEEGLVCNDVVTVEAEDGDGAVFRSVHVAVRAVAGSDMLAYARVRCSRGS